MHELKQLLATPSCLARRRFWRWLTSELSRHAVASEKEVAKTEAYPKAYSGRRACHAEALRRQVACEEL